MIFISVKSSINIFFFVFLGRLIQSGEKVATLEWLFVMLIVLFFFILSVIVIYVVKYSREGKYVVHKSEAARGRHDNPEEPHFYEYSKQ